MATHGRKYGEKDSHPIPLWNGIFDHYDRIGMALWAFAWLIDRITEEVDGVGRVLGGKPIKIGEIVETMRGATYKSVRSQLDTLEEQGYISRRRTPYGFVIEVRNSRKWGIWTPKESVQKGQSLPSETSRKGQSDAKRLPLQGAEIAPTGRNKEDSTEHSSKETQQKAAVSEFWTSTGLNPARLPAEFRSLCESLVPTRDGQTLGEFMGVCMDGWEALGAKRQPREFVQAANAIRGREKNPPPTPINYLPDVPFRERRKGEPCQTKS